jgi:hypothetical protein
VVELSPGVALVGISAEPLVGLIDAVKRAIPGTWIMPIGYIDQVHCYLPSDRDLSGKGYEVTGFRGAFGMDGTLREGIDAEVERLVRGARPGASRA